MVNSSLINPFELLGVTPESKMSDVKSAYYNLSLICHPDKGGNASEFDVVHNAYMWVKHQLESRVENTEEAYATLENEFKVFCDEQKSKPPTFHQIFVENNEEAKRFHQMFEAAAHRAPSPPDGCERQQNPFSLQSGYGDTMDSPRASGTPSRSDLGPIPTRKTKVAYTQDIIKYTDPTSETNTFYGTHQRFDLDKEGAEVNDYSQKVDGLSMMDYKIAHSEPLPYDSNDTNPYHNNETLDRNLDVLMYNRSHG